MTKRKPLVYPGRTVTAAEKFADSPEAHKSRFVEPPEGGWDSHYVPGYSDARHQNAMLEAQGRRAYDLDIELKWVHNSRRGFHADKHKGWRVINDAEQTEDGGRSAILEAAGYGWEHHWEIVNGTIQKDDLVLAYMPGEDYRALMAKEAEERAYLEGRTPAKQTSSGLQVEERKKIHLGADDVSFEGGA